MKIFAPNIKPDDIGGGFTFYRNLRKGLKNKVHFVDTWQESDIVFITSVTLIDKTDLHEAKRAGKKIVIRVDNVPRKSRNTRSTPHQRLKEFGDLADVVVYQSKWSRDYCYPLCGDGTIIYNGVDTDIFKPNEKTQNKNRYLFAYHGKNEQKNFWTAHLMFQYIFRENPSAVFWFVYDFGSETQKLQEANFDFWNGEKYLHIPKQESPEEMAEILQQCGTLIYPSINDAAPNMVLEAVACGLDVIGQAPKELAGTDEMLTDIFDISLERMSEEYYGLFDMLHHEPKI